MTRFLIQVALTLAVLVFAWSKGGKPERYVATIYFALVFSGIARWLVVGHWSEEGYTSVQTFRFVVDAAALFAESVRLNNFERVRVLPRALAAEPGRGVDMTYESGAESGLGSRRAA